MSKRIPLSLADKVTVAGLVVAVGGVLLQIISGHDYPAIPPVFLILLIPAGLIAFGRWRWTPVLAVLAGLFLTFGLFASGQSRRQPARRFDRSVGPAACGARRRRSWYYGNDSQLSDAP
jgi:hypothetical protein